MSLLLLLLPLHLMLAACVPKATTAMTTNGTTFAAVAGSKFMLPFRHSERVKRTQDCREPCPRMALPCPASCDKVATGRRKVKYAANCCPLNRIQNKCIEHAVYRVNPGLIYLFTL